MPSTKREEWPAGVKKDVEIANDVAAAGSDRSAAIGKVNRYIEDVSGSEPLRNQWLSLCANLLICNEVDDPIAVQVRQILAPHIEFQASRILCCFPVGETSAATDGAETIEESLRQGAFVPETDTFDAWCFRELRKRHLEQPAHPSVDSTNPQDSELSSNVEHPKGVALAAEKFQKVVDSATGKNSPQRADPELLINYFSEMAPTKRLTILLLSGLWKFLPSQKWKEWLDDIHEDRPIAPAEFTQLKSPKEREEWVASMLCIRPTTVSLTWTRGIKGTVFLLDQTK